MQAAGEDPPPSLSPIQLLPDDTLHQIFSRLPLRQTFASRSVCPQFRDALSSPPFLSLLPPLRLLALRHPRHHHHQQHHHHHPLSLIAFDPFSSRWLHFPLSFLPFPSLSPATASSSFLYLWADPSSPSLSPDSKPAKSLVLCNPLTRSFRVLPPLGSAWSRHGTVIAAGGAVFVLTELAALSYSPEAVSWRKFSLNLPSKPRTPVVVGASIYALCDIGNPWRSHWKLFSCAVADLGGPRGWVSLERLDWGDIVDTLKRPRLVRGAGDGCVLMIGGLRSSFALDAPCSTVLILRLDLGTMEWEEAGRMPPEMYRCFAGVGEQGAATEAANAVGNNKVKVFGGDGRVWFSGKRVRGRIAMWKEKEEMEKGSGLSEVWRWVDGAPGYEHGVYRGFVFDAAVTEIV